MALPQILQERIQQRGVEQVVDVLVRQITVDIPEVLKMISSERVFERIGEQVDVPVPQVVEQIGVR